MANSRGFKDVPRDEIKFVRSRVELIGSRLQSRRREIGLTQERLAEKLQISVVHLRAIEIGFRMPSLPMLIRICRALKLDITLTELK